MAEITAFRNNATDYPVYGLPWTVVLPMLDADGDLVTGATTPDAEISKNGDTFGDCTNESTEIATSSGIYYLALTATELTADIAAIIAKSATSGMKTTPLFLYPKKLPLILTAENAGEYDSTTTINLGSNASAQDDYYNGCIVYIYGGTGAEQVRMITDYVGSTKLATVHVAWATNPDATSDVKVYRTELAPYVNDKIGFSLAATGADLILKSSTFVQAIVAAINELATYGLTALNTLLVTTGIKAATIPEVTLAANQYVNITRPSGAVVSGEGTSTTTFKTNLTSEEDDYIKDAYLKFISGENYNQVKKISAYNGSTKYVTTLAFTNVPQVDDAFVIINE